MRSKYYTVSTLQGPVAWLPTYTRKRDALYACMHYHNALNKSYLLNGNILSIEYPFVVEHNNGSDRIIPFHFVIRIKSTGDILSETVTLREARLIVKSEEKADLRLNQFEPDYYEIYDQWNEEIVE